MMAITVLQWYIDFYLPVNVRLYFTVEELLVKRS
jgi:hypothetical protein